MWRYLTKAGLVNQEPKKRPRASYIRFQADQPNECWQADFTHYRLDDRSDCEILTFLDDHSRCALSVSAHRRVTGPIVTATFAQTVETYGVPASTLTDNGMVFTTRLAGGKGGRNSFETALRRLGVTQKNSRPNHPTTCGKVERFQQTLKKWLDQQPTPETVAELQAHCDLFANEYNQRRPHRSLPNHCTPATAYNARPKAGPGNRSTDRHLRVRRDRVDSTGSVTLRHNGRLHHIGIGRTHARTPVILLVDDLDIRIIHAPPENYSEPSPSTPTGTTSPSTRAKHEHGPTARVQLSRMSRDITERRGWDLNPRAGSTRHLLSREARSTRLRHLSVYRAAA